MQNGDFEFSEPSNVHSKMKNTTFSNSLNSKPSLVSSDVKSVGEQTSKSSIFNSDNQLDNGNTKPHWLDFLETGTHAKGGKNRSEKGVQANKLVTGAFKHELSYNQTQSNQEEQVGGATFCKTHVEKNSKDLENKLLEPLQDLSSGPRTECNQKFDKVYWKGGCKHWVWGNPLGKLHRQGEKLFEASGWRLLHDNKVSAIPVFFWGTRKAGDFPATSADTTLPLIRPFPQNFTNRLNDKACFAKHLTNSGNDEIHPETRVAAEFLESSLEAGGSVLRDEQSLWFLKYSLGVKGNGVYVYNSLAELLSRLKELNVKDLRRFIVQRGVAPPALRDGRKWALRVHALLRGLPSGQLSLYCHSDMIILEHGQPHTCRTDVRAAHISNSGNMKHWPNPVLLQDEVLADKIRSQTQKAFLSVLDYAPRGPYTPADAELCQVFGLDFVTDESGRPWLLEVNDYPAIASGTMGHVDKRIYTNLVHDVLSLVVLPKLDGAQPILGGWQVLEL